MPTTSWRILLPLLLLAVGCGPSPSPPHQVANDPAAISPQPPAPVARAPILVDSIHAHNYLQSGLSPDNHNYHQMYGLRRAMDHLAAQGFAYEEETEGEIDGAQLAGRKLLVLNLVSADRPSFLISEIAAIRDFVAGGGSLFAVVDHSNCYFHANVLRPLFAELGMVTHVDTICEEWPNKLGFGNGWVSVTRFTDHPVTRGLKTLVMQTGGRVDQRWAVALTSDDAWADQWIADDYGHNDYPGYFGNWERDASELGGPLGVVAAKELGRGKIVVIGDQNMIGDTFINFADNYRLWLNSAAWLLDDPRLADPEKYVASRSPRVVLYEDMERALFAANHDSTYHRAYVVIARHFWTFVTDRLEEAGDPALLVFPQDDSELPAATAAAAARHLQGGKNILVLDNDAREQPLASPLLAAIAKALPHGSQPKVASATPQATVVSIPGGGTIRLLNSPARFDNFQMELPYEKPSPEHAARTQELVREIRAVLP